MDPITVDPAGVQRRLAEQVAGQALEIATLREALETVLAKLAEEGDDVAVADK